MQCSIGRSDSQCLLIVCVWSWMEDHTWATGGIVQGSIDERVKPLREQRFHFQGIIRYWEESKDPIQPVEGSLVVGGRRKRVEPVWCQTVGPASRHRLAGSVPYRMILSKLTLLQASSSWKYNL